MQTGSSESEKQSLGKTLSYLIRALRPKQWSKNLLVVLPIIFAVKLTDWKALSTTVTYAVLFCFASSSVYLMNDVIDIEQDRVHPGKCKRPIASGKISVPM